MTSAPTLPTLEDYPRRYCPICGNVVRRRFRPGPGGRPDASCPRCRSLERHRFLAILLDVLGPGLGDLDVLLEVAPSPETSPLLARLAPRTHLRLDLGADNRLVDVLGSLTDLPLADGSVDLLVCYHVLEHVPDDRAAMREIARVLSATGLGLVQVPHRPDTPTDEDPDAPEDERIRRFGQADHVRYYGDDFEQRLVDCGLAIQRFTPRDLIGDRMALWLHLNPVETVWLVRPVAGSAVPDPEPEAPSSLVATLDALLDELVAVRGELVTQRRRGRRLQRQVEELRARRRRSPVERGRRLVRAGVRRARRSTRG